MCTRFEISRVTSKHLLHFVGIFHLQKRTTRQVSLEIINIKRNRSRTFHLPRKYPVVGTIAQSKRVELKILKAIEEKKIFTIIGGSQFDPLRDALKARGWIEKNVLGDRKKHKFTLESRMVQDQPSYFVCLPRNHENIKVKTVGASWINRISKHPDYDFTRKDGLKRCQDEIHWHYKKGASDLNTPRTFTMHAGFARLEFEKEFKFTSATSFLAFLNFHSDVSALFSEHGTISSDLIECALLHVESVLKIQRHEDIDVRSKLNGNRFYDVFQAKRFDFQVQCDSVMKEGKQFRWHENVSIEKLKMKIRRTLSEVYLYWPQMVYDGFRNIWVLKPYEGSCGKGVCLMNNYREIMDHLTSQHEHFIVQKYIERPFLIRSTKFDIRQHFVTLIADGILKIWFYRDSFLKFSSEKFNLDDLHWSIHLTNNILQLKHKSGMWNSLLPTNNMWTREQFRSHLYRTGRRGSWEKLIYPKMKENVIGAVLASLEGSNFRDRSFELNGADFLLAFDMEPILLEINSSPNLSFTTSVKEEICGAIIRDLVECKLKIYLN